MDNFAIAQIEAEQDSEFQSSLITLGVGRIKTPQRRARYSDKQRIRLKDAKKWAFQRSGCSSTAEIKKYLQVLGQKLDLRLTSAWLAIVRELAIAINSFRSQQRASSKVGDRVRLVQYKPTLAYLQQWEPFAIVAIVNGIAQLDLLAFPVPIKDLKVAS